MSGIPRDLRAAILVAVAAVVPRLWLLASTLDAGLFADMADYHARAQHLFDHGRLYPDAFRVPFYPVTVAGAFAALGPTLLSARVLQTAIFTLIAVVTYVIATRLTTPRRAFIAALVVAWYPGFLLYTVYLMAEPLFTLLMLLAILCAIHVARPADAIGAGALAGLATLTRQAGVSVLAGIVVAVCAKSVATHGWRRAMPRAAGSLGLIVVAFVVAMAPWAIRNYSVFGRWMPLETSGGITFLMANYEGATGRYLLSDWANVTSTYLSKGNEFDASKEGYRLGVEKIQSNPMRIASLVPRRLAYLFDVEGREHLWLYTSGYFKERSSSIVRAFGWGLIFSFPLVVLAAVLGLSLGPRPQTTAEQTLLWVLAVMLLQQTTIYGDPRFHLPFVPLFAILAARPWQPAVMRERWRVGLGATLAIILLGWWGWRIPEQLRLLELAAAPGGSALALPY